MRASQLNIGVSSDLVWLKVPHLIRCMVVVLAIAACTPGAGTIQVRTEGTSYRAGDQVIVTITNGTPDTILLMLCGSRSEHMDEGQRWTASVARSCVHQGDGGGAPGRSRHEPPRGMPSSSARAWSRGRVRLHRRHPDGRVVQDFLSVSNTFEIQQRYHHPTCP